LKELTLDNNQLDGSRLRILEAMLHQNKGLKILNMNHCGLGEGGADFIA